MGEQALAGLQVGAGGEGREQTETSRTRKKTRKLPWAGKKNLALLLPIMDWVKK